MKTTFKRFAALLALLLVSTFLTATASAECASYYRPKEGTSLQPQSWLGRL